MERFKGDLIGKTFEFSKNNIPGKIVNEIKNTLVLEDGPTLLKSAVNLIIDGQIISNKQIKGRAEERIKQ